MESHGNVEVSIPRSAFFLGFIRVITTDMARRLELSEIAVHQIEMAVSEAVTNIIEHSKNEHPIHICFKFTPERLHIILKSEGQSYQEDFMRRDENFLQRQILERKERGYGIAIMKKLMDEVHYRYLSQEGNELELVKYRR